MRQLLPLLRQFLMPFQGWPWACYAGLVLLLVFLVVGLFYPRVAFGLAMWDYVILLAIPFAVAPKMLRALLCNQRLGMVPGLQSNVVLALLIFTLLQSCFIGFFATVYDVYGDAASHLRNAAQLFVANSIYILVMQYAVTTRAAIAVLSIFPLLSVGVVLGITQGVTGDLPDAGIATLLLLTLVAWASTWVYTRGHHSFRSEHRSLLVYRYSEFQKPPLAHWLLAGGDALAAPDATLMLGYPANVATRFRVTLYGVLVGPLLAAAFIAATGYGDDWAQPPSLLDFFIACSLMPAMFQSFQSVDWAARLRLIWLRRPALREHLWSFLEKQSAINAAVVTVVAVFITGVGLLFSRAPAAVLLHYPLLVLLFNLFYGYYSVCARIEEWSTLLRIAVIWIATALAWIAIAWALKQDSSICLYLVEAMISLLALATRQLARSKLSTVDWLKVKPLRSSTAALTST